ncbi:hypothetical protein PROFUN_14174 [Planoprotostelium fungivorum]|uniref:Uncharacterized protein n=1 Tax=Planoprotostelium fungivorum TaxID=1890364 RepID=A0A2P6N0U2_9EUKA|nr:hypothetical protein PROFUN_14174 [Planoprotostelium fungivorum]
MRRGAVVEDVSVQIEESFRSNFPRLRVSTEGNRIVIDKQTTP